MQAINKFGYEIRMACFSCRNAMESGHKDKKKCRLFSTETHRRELCEAWEMREGLENAGKGDGRIKAPEYLAFICKYHGDVNVNDLRKDYLSRNPSIYWDR